MTRWRARLFLWSFADLPDECRIDGHDCRAKTLENEQSGCRLSLVDIFIESLELKEAYCRAFDLADDLTDRVSFLSYAPSTFEMLSVTVPTTRFGEEFQIAIPNDGFRRSRAVIDAKDIASLDNRSSDSVSIALRMFRRGLSAKTPYQVLTDLWTSLDAIAQAKAAAQGDYIEQNCPKCHAVRRVGPASQRHVRLAFVEANPADKTDEDAIKKADNTRRTRGKLVHGAKLHDAELRREVEEKLSSLQAAAAVELVKTLKVKTKTHRCQHLGLPYLGFKAVITGPNLEDLKVLPEYFEASTQLSFLPDRFSDGQHFQIDVGMILPIPMHPFGFPDVI